MKPSRSRAVVVWLLFTFLSYEYVAWSWWDKLFGKITSSPTESHGTSGGRGPTIKPPETIFHPHADPMRRIPERERRGP